MKIHGIDVTGEAGQELMRMVHEHPETEGVNDGIDKEKHKWLILEHLASVLRVECDECGGEGMVYFRDGVYGDYEMPCKPCQGEGTRTIISIWEARYAKDNG